MAFKDFRLLQVIAGAEQGGAESFFLRLAIAFHRRGIEQHVVMRPFPGPLQVLAQHNVPVTVAPFRRVLDFTSTHRIRRVIQQFSPTVVLTWMSRASCLTPRSSALFIARLGGYYDLKYYRKASYLIGNTPDIVAYFHQKGWPPERTCYLPNFPSPPVHGSVIRRQELDTPDNVPLLLALGRFHDDKAFDILIPALARIPQAYLWLGGEGEKAAQLHALAQRYRVAERIRFLGWRSDISALYQACDIYVCPSRIEPLGNVILEAWAHHKPVVAANSAGPAGLIQPYENGLLVPVDDIDALAKALLTVIQDKALCQRIADKGFQTYQAHFTEDTVVNAYLHFFKRIIAENKP
jgi:glycosyltransferase involved in cell wall biosynthesis